MKKLILSLCLVLLHVLPSAAAGFTSSTPQDGTSYYLYNVYQSKFLSYGNAGGTQVTLDNQRPLCCTLQANGTGYLVNTHYSLTQHGYQASVDNYLYVSPDDKLPYVNAYYGASDETATQRQPQRWKLQLHTSVPNAYTLSCTLNGVEQVLMFGAGTACSMGQLSEGYNAERAAWRLVSQQEYDAYKAKKRFTVASLNVDGMPKSISILGFYNYTLNPDAKEAAGATAIGSKLKTMGYDVVGVSEDFNFHSQLWDQAWNGGVDNAAGYSYNPTTHRGGIDVKASTYLSFLTQSTLFDTDGLCLFYKRSNVDEEALKSSEQWTPWQEHHGYTDDGADGLINKGYRYYLVRLADGTEFDLYILHMDAETSEADNAARKSQLLQLVAAIKATDNKRPIIVMGDTNCRYTRDPLEQDFLKSLNSDPRFSAKDAWIDFGRDGIIPTLGTNALMVDELGYRRGEVVDKVYYINHTESPIELTAESYVQDLSFVNESGEPLADHWPCVVEFSYTQRPAIGEDADDLSGTYYLYNQGANAYLKAGGWHDTHAVVGTYGTPFILRRQADGTYTMKSYLGFLGQGDPYMDASTPGEWTLTPRSGGYQITYTDKGAKKALSASGSMVETDNPGPNQRLVLCVASSASRNQRWELHTREQMQQSLLEATAAQPYNCTYLLPGANFDVADPGINAWENNATSASKITYNLSGGATALPWGNPCAEFFTQSYSGITHYSTGWSLKQTLRDLPNGRYRVTLQGFYRDGSINQSNPGTSHAILSLRTQGDASHVEQPLPSLYAAQCTTNYTGQLQQDANGYYIPNSMSDATHFFNHGHYSLSLEIDVTDGTLTLELSKPDNTKDTEGWACFDNFQLYYLGQSAEETAVAVPALTSPATQIHDLKGRAVTSPRRGIYIQRGKKYVVR